MIKDKERLKKYRKKYRLKNLDKIKGYYYNNLDKIKEYNKKYQIENKDRISEIKRKYNLINKIKIRKDKRKWKLKNWKENEGFRLKENLRHRIYLALKGTVKSKKTMDLIGISINDLWSHLEKSFKPGMTKNNYGKIWHIDHKIPCAVFDLTKPKEQVKCFHFTNLQALFVKENLSKGAKLEWQN
jgi:hypothetical protein